MSVKCVMIVSVCCYNAGKVYDDELLFDYSMPADMRTAPLPAKMIKHLRDTVKSLRPQTGQKGKKHVI